MPYTIRHKDSKYQVVNKETGKVKGTHESRDKAVRQMRLLQGVEHGWKPTRAQDGAIIVPLPTASETLRYAFESRAEEAEQA